jgi:hypothetical protein
MPTPFRPIHERSPMMPSPFQSGPNASEYPHRTHCTLIRHRMKKLCITVERTFFRRTRPP